MSAQQIKIDIKSDAEKQNAGMGKQENETQSSELKEWSDYINPYFPTEASLLLNYKTKDKVPKEFMDHLVQMIIPKIAQMKAKGEKENQLRLEALSNDALPLPFPQNDFISHPRIIALIQNGLLTLKEALDEISPENLQKLYTLFKVNDDANLFNQVNTFISLGVRPKEIASIKDSYRFFYRIIELLNKGYSFEDLKDLQNVNAVQLFLLEKKFELALVKQCKLSDEYLGNLVQFLNIESPETSKMFQEMLPHLKTYTNSQHMFIHSKRIKQMIAEGKFSYKEALDETSPEVLEAYRPETLPLITSGIRPCEIKSIKADSQYYYTISEFIANKGYAFEDIKDLSSTQFSLLRMGFALDIIRLCKQQDFGAFSHELNNILENNIMTKEELAPVLPQLDHIKCLGIKFGLTLKQVCDSRFAQLHSYLIMKGYEWEDIIDLGILELELLNKIQLTDNKFYTMRQDDITQEERELAKKFIKLPKDKVTPMHLMFLEMFGDRPNAQVAEYVLSLDFKTLMDELSQPIQKISQKIAAMTGSKEAHRPMPMLLSINAQRLGSTTQNDHKESVHGENAKNGGSDKKDQAKL